MHEVMGKDGEHKMAEFKNVKIIPIILLMVCVTVSFVVFTSTSCFANQSTINRVIGESEEFSCLSSKEAELIRLVNEYRESQGLPHIENSRSLNMVARIHAIDLFENSPAEGKDSRGYDCNLHSWSKNG